MRMHHLLVLSLALLLTHYAGAQVGVEVGVTGAVHAGSVDPLRRLGSTVSRSVFGSAGAIPIPAVGPPSSSGFSMAPGAATASRAFVPRAAGHYVAGISWRNPGDTPVVLNAGAQEVAGTTAAPVLLHFEAAAGSPCSVMVRATGSFPAAGLAGDLDFVREVGPGEAPSKSLLMPDQRLAEFTRRGPRPSVLPLLANLADRHLKSVESATDLDEVFDRALASTAGVTPADLQSLVRDYDALPEAVKSQCFTGPTLALRTLAAPTVASVSALFSQARFGAGSGYSGGMAGPAPRIAALEPAVPAGGAYAPGATIRITGENFAPQPERNQIYLYPEVAGLYPTRPLPVTAATQTALLFQLPADLPDGRFHLTVSADRLSASLAGAVQVSKTGLKTAPGELAAGPASRYRLSCLRLECVDETNPEWWGNDDVVLLLAAVGDQQAVTRASGPLHDFGDGAAQPVPTEDRPVFADVKVAQGLGVAVELWRWNPPAPSSGLARWALRESFADALAAPEIQYTDPKRQDDVSAELAVWADLIGYQQAIWTAAELQQLLQPGQKLEKTVDLRQGDSPAEYDASGYYKLTFELERLD